MREHHRRRIAALAQELDAQGADAFIAKPFSVGSVQRSVTLACMKRHLTKAPKQDVLDTIRLFDRQDAVLEID